MRAGVAKYKERLRHVKRLFIYLLRPLRDDRSPGANVAGELLQTNKGVQHLLFAALGVLRDKLLPFFKQQMDRAGRRLLTEEKLVGKVSGEARLLRVALKLRDVNDRRQVFINKQVSYQFAGTRIKREIPMQTA